MSDNLTAKNIIIQLQEALRHDKRICELGKNSVPQHEYAMYEHKINNALKSIPKLLIEVENLINNMKKIADGGITDIKTGYQSCLHRTDLMEVAKQSLPSSGYCDCGESRYYNGKCLSCKKGYQEPAFSDEAMQLIAASYEAEMARYKGGTVYYRDNIVAQCMSMRKSFIENKVINILE